MLRTIIKVISYYSKLSLLFFYLFCPSGESYFNRHYLLPVVEYSIRMWRCCHWHSALANICLAPYPIVILLQHQAAAFFPPHPHACPSLPLSLSLKCHDNVLEKADEAWRPPQSRGLQSPPQMTALFHLFSWRKTKGKTEQERRQPRRGTPEELTPRIIVWRAEFFASQQKRKYFEFFFPPLNLQFNQNKCCTEIILGFCSSILMSSTCKNLSCRWKQLIDLEIDFAPLLIMYFATGFCVINDSHQAETCRRSFLHVCCESVWSRSHSINETIILTDLCLVCFNVTSVCWNYTKIHNSAL